MSDYFFHQMTEELQQLLDLPPLVYPVRKEKSLGFFHEGKLFICKVLDELDLYLQEHPGQRDLYADAIAKLAWLEGMEAGRKGYMEHAAYYLRMALEYQPDNLSLCAEFAAALLSLGQKEECLQELEYLISRSGAYLEPLVWLLAARLHQEAGNSGRANELLGDLALA